MKTQLRLNSVIPHGVGSSSESGSIDLIYTFLLKEFKQEVYSYININQIGDDLNEFIRKDGKKIYINIRYPAYEYFQLKSVEEKNLIRLDVIHTALLRIAEKDKKLNAGALEAIREKILEKSFSFDFVCKTYMSKKNKNLLAKIIVHPEIDRFDYYALIKEKDMIKCSIHLYCGLTNLVYYSGLFAYGNWKNDNMFIITGIQKEVEIHILVDECKAEFKNLTNYSKPPYFEMMRADITEEDRDKSHQNWLHSLPPAHTAINTHEPN